MPHIEGIATRLLSDLIALPERVMRLALLARTLSGLEPPHGAKLLEMIYRKGPKDRGASIVRALMVDNDGVLESLGQAAYASIYLASLRLGLPRIARFFTEFEPLKEGVSGYEEEEFIKTEQLSLGERRSLSKSSRIKDLERLLSDPDPVVAGNLLDNPRITEREVLKIASRRPNSQRVLKLVALHGKWSRRYDVAKAVSRNPYAPPRVSIALIEGMLAQDLAAVSEDTTIHPEVRQAAKEIIEDRGKREG